MGKKSKKRKQQQREAYHNQGYNPSVTVGTTMQTKWYKNCHDGPIEVFTIGTSKIYAGSQWEIDCSLTKFDVFICANGDKGKFTSMVQLEDTRGLLSATTEEIEQNLTPTFLTMDIPDGGAPSVGPRFWKSLVTDIRDKNLKVAVYCQGGHGRTGIVLACLAWYGRVVSCDEDVVQTIRELYCSEALETTTQINYLRQLGMQTEAKPSFKPGAIGQVSQATASAIPVPAPTVPVAYRETSDGVVTVVAGAATEPPTNPLHAKFTDFDGPQIDEWLAERKENETIQEYFERTKDEVIASDDEIREWEKVMIQEQEQKDEAKRLGLEPGAWPNDYAG